MTEAILCDGCETWETIGTGDNTLKFISSDGEDSHLCSNCTKMFDSWLSKIPSVEDGSK